MFCSYSIVYVRVCVCVCVCVRVRVCVCVCVCVRERERERDTMCVTGVCIQTGFFQPQGELCVMLDSQPSNDKPVALSTAEFSQHPLNTHAAHLRYTRPNIKMARANYTLHGVL